MEPDSVNWRPVLLVSWAGSDWSKWSSVCNEVHSYWVLFLLFISIMKSLSAQWFSSAETPRLPWNKAVTKARCFVAVCRYRKFWLALCGVNSFWRCSSLHLSLCVCVCVCRCVHTLPKAREHMAVCLCTTWRSPTALCVPALSCLQWDPYIC